jgi:hypothetical protein
MFLVAPFALADGGDAARPGPSLAPAGAREEGAPPANHLLAIIEGPIGVNLVMNVGGRVLKSEDSYDSTLETFRDNLDGPWVFDPNGFDTNQFAHPYQGSLYMTAARSLGVSFWWSSLYTGLGSFLWETAGEVHPPSVNDQITTTVAGILFGEALYRLSSRILDGGGERPSGWRELGAGAVAPMNGMNRLLLGDRHRDRRLSGFLASGELGAAVSLAGRDEIDGVDRDLDRGSVLLRGRFTHGLPDEDGWRFRRPFDHFDGTVSLLLNSDAFDESSGANLLLRGLLVADRYGRGRSSGLWGLWGAYDYLSPGDLRASSSAVALGTVGQVLLPRGFALQGTVYAGAGFGAGGQTPEAEDQRDYHFGLQAVGALEARLFWADRIRLRVASRQYLTGDELSPDEDSFEDITYGSADLAVRVFGRHALGVELTGARRHARYPDLPDTRHRTAQVSLAWTLVSERSMGLGSPR